MSAPDHHTLSPDEVLFDHQLSAPTRLVYYALLSYADRDRPSELRGEFVHQRLDQFRSDRFF